MTTERPDLDAIFGITSEPAAPATTERPDLDAIFGITSEPASATAPPSQVRNTVFGMLNKKERLSPAVQRNIADDDSGLIGGTMRRGKNLLGRATEMAGYGLGLFTEKLGFKGNSPEAQALNDAFDYDDLREASSKLDIAMSSGKSQGSVSKFVDYFESQGITDGKQMMTLLKDSIKENQWDSSTDDDTRVLSDGTVAVNPKFFAAPNAEDGIQAIKSAPVNDAAREATIEGFKLARKEVAKQLDAKTKSFDRSYRKYAAKKAEEGITDPEEVFFKWPGLDRNWAQNYYDVVRDTVAEGGRGIAQTLRGAGIGAASAVGAEGLAASLAEGMKESSEKSQFVSDIASARGQQGPIVGTGKELGTTVIQMIPMFVGAGAGRAITTAGKSAAVKTLGGITAGTSVYGWAGAQGYASLMQTALETAQNKAESEGRELSVDEIDKTVQDFQGAALANGFQTMILSRLLRGGAEQAAFRGAAPMNGFPANILGRSRPGAASQVTTEGLTQQAAQMTGRDVVNAFRQNYGSDGVRKAIMATKPEMVKFAKQAYEAGKAGFKDEALEEGVNQYLEGVITKMSGADPDKTWDQIGQETFKGTWMGGFVGSGLPIATKTLGNTDPATLAARQLLAGAQDAAPASVTAAVRTGSLSSPPPPVAPEPTKAPFPETESPPASPPAPKKSTASAPGRLSDEGIVQRSTQDLQDEEKRYQEIIRLNLKDPEGRELAGMAQERLDRVRGELTRRQNDPSSTEPSPTQGTPTDSLPAGQTAAGESLAPAAEPLTNETTTPEPTKTPIPEGVPEARNEPTPSAPDVVESGETELTNENENPPLELQVPQVPSSELRTAKTSQRDNVEVSLRENRADVPNSSRLVSTSQNGADIPSSVETLTPEQASEISEAESALERTVQSAEKLGAETLRDPEIAITLQRYLRDARSRVAEAKVAAKQPVPLDQMMALTLTPEGYPPQTDSVLFPEGYVKQGDLYVYQPTQDTQDSPPTEVPTGTNESLKTAFNLTDEQAAVAEALGKVLGLTPESVSVVRGGTPGSGALLQANDAEYLAAVEAGDMETAQRMVDEAARAAGYDTKAYHGTRKTFNEFDDSVGVHIGTKEQAEFRLKDTSVRGGESRVIPIVAQARKPLRMNDVGKWEEPARIIPQLIKLGIIDNSTADRIRREAKKYADDAFLMIKEELDFAGYDSIVYSNKVEGKGDSYLLLSSSQIKSADPVTYDSNGNVIPLSQRFDPASPDIRFQGAKGSTELVAAGKVLIRGLTDPDFTTAVHEQMHAARMLGFPTLDPTEVATLEKWAGAKDGNWNVAADEKLARGWERYLADGKAPLARLQAVFDKIASWFSKVYATIQGSEIDIDVTPEVRAVFDRMVSRLDTQTQETAEITRLAEQIDQNIEPPLPPEPNFSAPAPTEDDATSLKHAQSDADRVRFGLKPRFERPAYTDQAAWDSALAAEAFHRAEGLPGTAGSDLLNRLLREPPRALTKDEHALLLHEKLVRELQVERTNVRLNSLTESTSAEERKDAQHQSSQAQLDYDTLLTYADAAGSASGLSLQARKMMVRRDYSLAAVVRNLQAAKNTFASTPQPWTPADQKKAIEMAEKLQAAQERVESLESENTAQAEIIERLTADVMRAQTQAGRIQRDSKVRKLVKDKLDPLADAAMERLKNRNKVRPSDENKVVAYSGLAPETADDIRDVAIVASRWFIDKALTIQEFSTKVIAEFGEWVSEFVNDLFTQSQNIYNETAESVTGESAPTPATVLDSIDTTEDLTREDVWKLARAHVIAGKRGRAVLNAVFEDLTPMFPELTRENLAELFTNYGKVVYPSQKEVPKELQRIRQLERIGLKLQDVREGRMPKRTGYQRGEQDAEVRALEKEFREALKESGLQVTDPEQQLQTALGAAKRRMRNQIEEIEIALRKMEPRTTDVRQPVEFDEEAVALRTRLEEVRAEYDAVFGQKMTKEKRIAAALRLLDRQIAEEADMLEKGVLRKVKGESVTSAEIETKRKQLSEMRKNRRALWEAQNGETMLDQAKRRVNESIDRLQKALEAGDVRPQDPRRPFPEPDEELKALIAVRESLQDEIDEARRALPLTPAQERDAVRKAADDAQKTLDKLKAKLDSGDLSVARRAMSQRTRAAENDPLVRKIRSEIGDLNKELQRRRREAKPKMDPEVAREKRILASMEKRRKDLERRIREKDFTKKGRPDPVNTVESRKAQFELEKLKAEYSQLENEYKYANAPFLRKTGAFLISTGNLLKLLTLGLDVGVVFRQLGTTFQFAVRDLGMLAPTKRGRELRQNGSYLKRVLSQGVKSFLSEEYENQVYEAIKNRPNAGWDKPAGLVFSAPFDTITNAKEDIPTANLIDKWPWWVWPALAGLKVSLVGASFPVAAAVVTVAAFQKPLLRALDRAQRAMTNESRAMMFDATVASMPGQTVSVSDAKYLARAIMVGTGRGTMPQKFEGAVPLVNQFLLATRFYLSRIQAMSFQPLLAGGKEVSGAARNEVKKMYGRSVTGRAVLYTMMAVMFGKAILGDDEEEEQGIVFNPFNPDFGRLRLSDGVKIDFMSGINGFAGAAARILGKRRTDPETGYVTALGGGYSNNVGDEAMNFIKGKMNLQLAFVLDTFQGEYFGGKPVNLKNALEEATTAIIINDTVKVFEELGPVEGSLVMGLMLTGAGTKIDADEVEERMAKIERRKMELERKLRERELNRQ